MPPRGRPGPGKSTGNALHGLAQPLFTSHSIPKSLPPHGIPNLPHQPTPSPRLSFPTSLSSNSCPLAVFAQPGPTGSLTSPQPNALLGQPADQTARVLSHLESQRTDFSDSFPFPTKSALPSAITSPNIFRRPLTPANSLGRQEPELLFTPHLSSVSPAPDSGKPGRV